jgi:CBS domain-containing protein
MQLKSKDVGRKPITLQPKNTLYDARNTMLRYNISRVIVAKNSRPLGIITEKDIARFLYRNVSTRRLEEIMLEEVMTEKLITVEEETDLQKCARLMLDKEISSLVVVDKGKLKGIFTKSDLVNTYARYYAGKHLVSDFMTRRVHTVSPDETTHMVLLLMANNRVSRVIVTRNRKPVGIITSRDLLPLSPLFGPDTYEIVRKAFKSHKRGEVLIPSGISAVFLARDVMKYDPITICKESDLADAAQIMVRNGISGLPVVDAKNDLAGIITKTDIIAAMAE